MTYFCDTYALIELFKANPKFIEFKGQQFVITILNLMEFYYHALAEKGEKQAKEWYSQLKRNLAEIDDETLFESMALRLNNKKLNLSYADAIGYICSKRMNIQFVTGDESFRNLENVIFIKR